MNSKVLDHYVKQAQSDYVLSMKLKAHHSVDIMDIHEDIFQLSCEFGVSHAFRGINGDTFFQQSIDTVFESFLTGEQESQDIEEYTTYSIRFRDRYSADIFLNYMRGNSFGKYEFR